MEEEAIVWCLNKTPKNKCACLVAGEKFPQMNTNVKDIKPKGTECYHSLSYSKTDIVMFAYVNLFVIS